VLAEISNPIKNIVLPAEHIRMRLIDANETYLLAARGTLKTTQGIALFVIERVKEMPRSSGVLVGLSYEDMGNNTINPFLSGLVEKGYNEGEHWVIGKKPPAHWPKPYLGIRNEKYDRVMSWWNGTAMNMVSLEKKAPANGLSCQWGVFDEVKFMDEHKLIDSIFPAFRGNEQYFEGKCSGYLSKFFATDKEADPVRIQWLKNKLKLVDPVRNAIIMAYQLQLDKLEAEFRNEETTKTRQRILEKEIAEIKQELHDERKDLVYVAEMSVEDVRKIHGERWYQDKKRNSTPRTWRVVYKNEWPEAVGDTFYPNYSKELHEHDDQNDIDQNKPFILVPDYQHSVAPISIAQLSKLPGNPDVTLNYVDEVYTLPDPAEDDIQPNGNGSRGSLKEATQLFCDRYKSHKKKTVYFVYDHTAKGRRINADEYYKIVEGTLRKNRWRVVKVYTGKAPDHYLKYTRTSEWLLHADKSLPRIQVNRVRCKKLIISINNSAAKTTSGKTEKNKEYENTTRYPNLDQSETTHFSDTFDMCNHAVLFLKKIKVVVVKMGATMR
jgi:hypothetical protein